MKTLNINQVNPTELTNYQSNYLNELIKLSEDFNEFYPCNVYLKFSDYDNAEHFEYAYVGAVYNDINFSITYSEHKKRYTINCEDFRTLRNVTSNTRIHIEKQYKEPQNIGVLNLKKITAWFEYYIIIFNELAKIDQANSNEKEAFLESIKGLPIEWHSNQKGGEMVKNGIVYEFKIEDTYVRESIKINYKVPSTLEAFLKLSDNKY